MMLNVTELREKLHAARHKDTEVAYVARKWMGKVLDELEACQNALAAAQREFQDLQSVIAAQEEERRLGIDQKGSY